MVKMMHIEELKEHKRSKNNEGDRIENGSKTRT